MAGIATAPAPAPQAGPKSWIRRVFRFLVLAGIVGVLFVAALIFHNNYTLLGPSKAQFVAELDQAIEKSTDWMDKHPEVMANPPLMFMVGDMASMSGQPRMQRIVFDYVHSKYVRQEGRRITWYYARMADGVTEVPPLTILDMGDVIWQDRLDAFGVAPQKVELPVQEKAELFSPTSFTWGTRLHQLVALDVLRRFNGPSPQLDSVINPVTEKVARETFFEFRVNDGYPQRIWTIFGAGRPDLVRKQWVLRLLAYQRPDGSWPSCWYGWCRGAFDFSLTDTDPAHVSVQGAYALYFIKYRYPEWIDQHFK